nr:retrovirus-related Pol polyprotein from transposon TNT 1-94 [Tanacetum cinerariifolium]
KEDSWYEDVKDRSRKILRVSQSGYVSKILNNFIIDNRKSVKMPLGGHFKLSLKDCSVRDCDVERMSKDCSVRDCDVERMSKVPYENAVESLMYLVVCTRPDIACAGNANVADVMFSLQFFILASNKSMSLGVKFKLIISQVV